MTYSVDTLTIKWTKESEEFRENCKIEEYYVNIIPIKGTNMW